MSVTANVPPSMHVHVLQPSEHDAPGVHGSDGGQRAASAAESRTTMTTSDAPASVAIARSPSAWRHADGAAVRGREVLGRREADLRSDRAEVSLAAPEEFLGPTDPERGELDPVRGAGLAERPLQAAGRQAEATRGRPDRKRARGVERCSKAPHHGMAPARLAPDRLELRDEVERFLAFEVQPSERLSDIAEHAVGIRKLREMREAEDDCSDHAVGPQLCLADDVSPEDLAVFPCVLEEHGESARFDELEPAEVHEPAIGRNPRLEPDRACAEELGDVARVGVPPRREPEQSRRSGEDAMTLADPIASDRLGEEVSDAGRRLHRQRG
jgi:hypothetical protein